MKNNKETQARFVLSAIAAAGLAVGANGDDITKLVRDAGAATYDLTGATIYSGYSNDRAFDGKYTDELSRWMANFTSGQTPTLYYHISDTFLPGKWLLPQRVVLRQSSFVYDVEKRWVKRMRVEASVDGETWVALAESAEDMTKEGMVPQYDFVFDIPERRRDNYRHYRFVMTSTYGDLVDFQELYIQGQVFDAPAADLTWDAAVSAWTNAEGQVCTFANGSRGTINSDLTIPAGGLVPSMLEVKGETKRTISGGALIFREPARVGVEIGGVQVDAPVKNYRKTDDTVAQPASGAWSHGYDVYLPRSGTATDAEMKTGKAVTYWTNRRLSDITGFKSATVGYSDGDQTAAFCSKTYENDGTTATAWFYRYYSYSANKNAWATVGVEFKQVGNDITARIIKGGYCWIDNATYPRELADQIPFGATTTYQPSGCKIYEGDTAVVARSGSTDIKNILAEETAIGAKDMTLFSRKECSLFAGLLPRDPNDGQVGTAIVYRTNTRLADITDFGTALLYYCEVPYEATPYHVTRTDDAISVQYQYRWQTALLCVKAEFRQSGNDVTARALYAKYTYQHPDGYDFDLQTSGGRTTIYDGTVSGGYGLSAIELIVDGNESATFAGDFEVTNEVALAGVDCVLAAAAVTLPKSFTGTGRAVLGRDAGVQAVTVVHADTSIASAKLTGEMSLSFGDGASLAIASADFSQLTALTVPADMGVTTLKFGQTLTKAELKKITASGKKAKQNAEGYIYLDDVRGLLLLLR